MKQRLRRILREAIKLDIKKGDVILTGRYKNKRSIVKDIGTDEYGQPTINGKSILKFKIEKQMPKSQWSAKSREELEESKRSVSMLRKTIHTMLLEEKKSAITDDSIVEIESLVSNFSLAEKGYNITSFDFSPEDTTADMVYTLTLQHVNPDFGRFIEELQSRGGRFATIYGDTPTSKTKIVRWLTGYKEGADIDERQKAAAIKVAQLAGLDAIQPIINSIESQFDCTCVANFIAAQTKNKGQSVFEFFIFSNEGAQVAPSNTPPPTEIEVNDEVVTIPVEPVPKQKKIKPPAQGKAPQLTKDQKKKGYNRINSQGHVRHVAELNELENIADHVVDLVLGESPGKEVQTLNAQDAHDSYQDVKNKSITNSDTFFRLTDDYYDNDLPSLVFHKGYIIKGGRIKSLQMMQQYQSIGSNRIRVTNTGSEDDWMEDPLYGVDAETKEFTPSKLGSKAAKDARRYVQQTRTNDEIIIYAQIEAKKNKYTGKVQVHTGGVTLYVYLLDRNF